jgi:hypothetical protein
MVINSDGSAGESGDRVQAWLNYLADPNERPVAYQYEPPPGVPTRTGRTVKQPMTILNGRSPSNRLTLDGQGFELVHHETHVRDFYDENEVKASYYPEVERLVKEATGAYRVVAFDHNVRNGLKVPERRAGIREPVKFAHNDYTLKSGPQRVRDLFGEEAEELLKHRFAVINVWRSIAGPIEESPIAVCDAQSMKPEDFVASDLKYRDRTGEVYSVAHNPNHRWYYFPKMRKDEALLLKCYDSATDGRARFTAHTAFDDPTSSPDAPYRQSIEARTLVFFKY